MCTNPTLCLGKRSLASNNRMVKRCILMLTTTECCVYFNDYGEDSNLISQWLSMSDHAVIFFRVDIGYKFFFQMLRVTLSVNLCVVNMSLSSLSEHSSSPEPSSSFCICWLKQVCTFITGTWLYQCYVKWLNTNSKRLFWACYVKFWEHKGCTNWTEYCLVVLGV